MGSHTFPTQQEFLAVKLVHDSVKWILRGCLLKNVVANSITREVKGPIPTLKQLDAHVSYKSLRNYLLAYSTAPNPHGSEFAPDLVIPTQVMVRFAYLRLATIAFNKSGSKARGPIDHQMLLFREKSSDYFLSWSELILQKDHSLFGSGKLSYKQLPNDVTDMPTDTEIEQHIIIARNRRALNRSLPEPSQSAAAESRPT
ncbi:hypothetical protein VP01_434g2 [Puccinia sorghi]|uniref:Uncharacterized protein n=1 Tax=Puccinia sorghi TaxID=27349 RepID=A0A0L6UPU1_9BASI|nr:hypothetical protein VP01_434g2 [Puccinia sorghi]